MPRMLGWRHTVHALQHAPPEVACQIGSDADLLTLHEEGRPGRALRQETSGQLSGTFLSSSWQGGLLVKILRDVKQGQYKELGD